MLDKHLFFFQFSILKPTGSDMDTSFYDQRSWSTGAINAGLLINTAEIGPNIFNKLELQGISVSSGFFLLTNP